MKPVEQISVLDIGANDYSLLKEFKRRGVKVEGVDPAANLVEQAGDITALVDFWGKDTWMKLKQAPYDLITGLNVFAHNKNPLEFLLACKQVLKRDGEIILEMPWLRETVARISFGQIYAEHISYFTVGSMQTLVERAGLRIASIKLFDDIHDGTLRFTLDRLPEPHSSQVKHFRLIELLAGFYEVQTYKDFGESVKDNLRQLEALLLDFKGRGARVVAYGASAKLSTLLGAFKGEPKKAIEYIVDNNELKHNRFQTDTEIPILPPSSLKVDQAGLVILISPDNFYREIKQRLLTMGLTNCKLIRYCPLVTVEDL
jgi:SAM-dependent methyltransferase